MHVVGTQSVILLHAIDYQLKLYKAFIITLCFISPNVKYLITLHVMETDIYNRLKISTNLIVLEYISHNVTIVKGVSVKSRCYKKY